MAEHFHGKYRSLHTSNGGAEIFLSGLLFCGSHLEDSNIKDVLNFLQKQLKKGSGSRSFDFYPMPKDLKRPEKQLLFLKIIQFFAQSLLADKLEEALNKNFYDRELQLKWVGFACEFYQLLAKSMPSEAPSLILDFGSYIDKIQLHRLLYRLTDDKKNSRLSAQVAALNKIIRLQIKLSNIDSLWLYYSDLAEVLIQQGKTKQAICTLNKGVEYAKDSDRQVLIDYAESLSNDMI